MKEKVAIGAEPAVEYDLYIAGAKVTSANCGDLSVIPGVTGTAKYDPATKTLTLDNATITAPGNGAGIWTDTDGLTVRVKGTVNVTAQENSGIWFRKPSTLTGGGTLNVTSSDSYGIYAYEADLTLDGLTVNAKGGEYGILGSYYVTLTVRNATVTAEGKEKGSICGFKALTLEGCEIIQPTGAAFSASLKGVALGGKIVKTKVTIAKDATAISAPEANAPLKRQGTYTLHGVRMRGTLESLPAGLYIVDGKKVVKK